MNKQTLRGLAKGFAKGAISKEDYRRSRTELVQGIIAGKIPLKSIDYEAPLKPTNELENAITEGIERDRTEVTSPQQTRKPKSSSVPPVKQNVSSKKNNNKSPFVFILVSVIIVLSLVLAAILFYPKPPESATVKISAATPDNSTPTSSTVSSTMDESIAGETLIANFLSEKSWDEESLDKFIASWSALTAGERESANQTKRMQRMKDSIYKRFLEGKALASIDSDKAQIKQQQLIEFADAIGINDSRLILD